MLAAIAAASALAFTPATERRVDSIVEAEIRARRTPGVAVGIVEAGRIVYARGFGAANLSRNIRVSPSTEFPVGQISQEFTAAAVLLLAQSGKVSLDDRVTAYLPNVTAAKYVTVRELLDQTSGLPHVNDWTHLVNAVNRGRFAGSPGKSYDPNPVNYLLAGLIVERISGVPLSDYVQQHVFLPLVMDGSLYIGDSGISPDHATGYVPVRDSYAHVPLWSATRTAGDTGVISNIYDLAKWDIEFPILLRVDAVRDMFTPGLPGSYDLHAMGWTIDQRGGRRFIWQNGELPGFQTMNAVLPDDHVAVIILANVDATGTSAGLPERVAGRILDVLEPPGELHIENAIMTRAHEWLIRLATGHIDRAQLTPGFSNYLSDNVVRNAHIAAYGTIFSIVPIASMPSSNGATEYEFLVRFANGSLHYNLTITPDGKVAFISFTP